MADKLKKHDTCGDCIEDGENFATKYIKQHSKDVIEAYKNRKVLEFITKALASSGEYKEAIDQNDFKFGFEKVLHAFAKSNPEISKIIAANNQKQDAPVKKGLFGKIMGKLKRESLNEKTAEIFDVLFAVCDGWDEGNGPQVIFKTKEEAKEWMLAANKKSPGRFNLENVKTKQGYEPSSDFDIKKYTKQYIG